MFLLLFSILRLPPPPTLFPYTTLFRSLTIDVYLTSPHLIPFGLSLSKPRGQQKAVRQAQGERGFLDRKSTRLNSSHPSISYAVFCLKKKKTNSNRLMHMCDSIH